MYIYIGTLGKGLSQNVGLYLSYDGGFSWQEVYVRMYMYIILIVF